MCLLPTFTAPLKAVLGSVRNKAKLPCEDKQRIFNCSWSDDDSHYYKSVSERQIFLMLQILCEVLVRRLLKTSELPGLDLKCKAYF